MSETPEPAGKGRATPSRKEREAARKQPIVAADRKAARVRARAQDAETREKKRIGMAAGDERYLPARDKGPQRRYARDFVDARFSFGEFMIPVVVIFLVGSFVPAISQYILFAVWAYVILAIIDGFIIGAQLRRRLSAKFGTAERGVSWYAAMRALQLRRLRVPKPQAARGQYPN
ncbi:DUF3043 domain-containing protein [Gryllotalpicola sp.]|uniref:DUF3043 domain-containing protein n=1 Tax=Gryllotalpicola sp. TaxID=1932787 RepID=UPI002605A0CA|nr:DUF3043 domain-containing protein [Gryllotalpicola sp.]